MTKQTLQSTNDARAIQPLVDVQTGVPEVRGKLGVLVSLLRRPGGADISDMMTATGWQEHSIRGAIAGALKKQRGLNITSEKTDGPRLYRIVAPASEPPEATPNAAAATETKAASSSKPRRSKTGG